MLWYGVGVKRYFDPDDTTDYFALRAPVILKHLKSARFSTKNGYFSVFCGSQRGCREMTADPQCMSRRIWICHHILWVFRITRQPPFDLGIMIWVSYHDGRREKSDNVRQNVAGFQRLSKVFSSCLTKERRTACPSSGDLGDVLERR